MRSKILVRILIVLLAAFLIFRIHQRVETYRIPKEFCLAMMIMFLNWPRLSGEGNFNMSTCKICGRQSAHNTGHDGLLCGRCKNETEDDDVEVEILGAITNGKPTGKDESKGQTDTGATEEGKKSQAAGRDLDGGGTGPGGGQSDGVLGFF